MRGVYSERESEGKVELGELMCIAGQRVVFEYGLCWCYGGLHDFF
jgi:hypothetical protein